MMGSEHKRYSRKQVIFMLAAMCLLMAAVGYAATLNTPNTFSSGSTISSSAVNANFDFLEKTMARGYVMSGSSAYITATSSAPQQLVSYSFTAPASGYVIAQASANYLKTYHSDTSYSQTLYLGIGTSATSMPVYFYSYTYSYDDNVVTYNSPNVQYMMTVSEGSSYTLYLNAYSSLGSSSSNYYYVNGPRMTVMFFPTYL